MHSWSSGSASLEEGFRLRSIDNSVCVDKVLLSIEPNEKVPSVILLPTLGGLSDLSHDFSCDQVRKRKARSAP